MKYFNLLAIGVITMFTYSCNIKKESNLPSSLVSAYCPNGPSSCTKEKVLVVGYLDGINIYDEKLFLWADPNLGGVKDKAFINSFIEVYYPKADLSKYFEKNNEHYNTKEKIKVIVKDATIKLAHHDHPGKDDVNYLTVDSIKQLEFYKLDKKGRFVKLN